MMSPIIRSSSTTRIRASGVRKFMRNITEDLGVGGAEPPDLPSWRANGQVARS